MLELKEIALEDESSFCEFIHKYKEECGEEKIPYCLNPRNLDFKEFIKEINLCIHKDTLPKGFVLARSYMILVDGRIVGCINLRIGTNDFILQSAGHIGYGIAPWERNKGYAKMALKKLLIEGKNIGMSNFLLTVDSNNLASQRVILSCGGIFEKVKDNLLYYWINLGDWKQEESAMAIVACQEKILVTKEWIYGKEVLSCPKGHIEEGETHIETAIRECLEETGVVLHKDDFQFEAMPICIKFMDHHNLPICKTIYPVVFKIDKFKNTEIKEERILAVEYMDINEFLKECSYDNVRQIIKQVYKL